VSGPRGALVAQAALAHVGSSSVSHVDVYQNVVRRPADAGPMLDQFYLHNRDMSSCGLFAVGCIRLAGCVEAECVAPYFPHGGPERDAVGDVQRLGHKTAAGWVDASPHAPPFKQGDVWVIANAQGMDAHVGVCIADAVVQADGSWAVQTCEGGQYSGSDSSAIEAFTRTWHLLGGKWLLGGRELVGYAVAELLPIPLPAPPEDVQQAATTPDEPHT